VRGRERKREKGGEERRGEGDKEREEGARELSAK
jgi:hypothetical protein